MTEQYLPKQDTRPTQIIYALYLAGLVTANVTLLIGVIIAYVYRKEAAPEPDLYRHAALAAAGGMARRALHYRLGGGA